jgi:hypothetical protein
MQPWAMQHKYKQYYLCCIAQGTHDKSRNWYGHQAICTADFANVNAPLGLTQLFLQLQAQSNL